MRYEFFFFCILDSLEGYTFRYFKMSLPEILMDLMGIGVSHKSRTVVFLPTAHPDKEKRVLQPSRELRELDPDSENIFSDDLWKKYLCRPEGAAFDELTMVQFYTWYQQHFGKDMDEGAQGEMGAGGQEGGAEEVADGDGEETSDNEEVLEDQEIQEQVAAAPEQQDFIDTSNKHRIYRRCTDRSKRIVRTKGVPMTNVEDAAIHLLKLNYVTRSDCAAWLEEMSVSTYFEVAWAVLPHKVLQQVTPFVGQQQSGAAGDNQSRAAFGMLNQGQTQLLHEIAATEEPQLVIGSAGTGKSTLLKGLVFYLRTFTEFEPIVLAPSGIAAMNIQGVTVHRYFGIISTSTKESDCGAMVNQFTVDWNLHVLRAQHKVPFFIVDEVAMMSKSLFEIVSTALQEITGTQACFGGIRLICFGDFGQLGPIVKQGQEEVSGLLHSEWLWMSAEILSQFRIHRLTTPCRQGPTEMRFFKFLEIIRRGPESDSERSFVQEVLDERLVDDKLMLHMSPEGVTVLTSMVKNVRNVNQVMVEKLSDPRERRVYDEVDSVSVVLDSDS